MQAVLAGTLNKKARMEFIAPLDPLFWDKTLVTALWDFRYSWRSTRPHPIGNMAIIPFLSSGEMHLSGG